MIDSLKNIAIDDKDIRIIVNLYWNQTATLTIEEDQTEE